ncbi:MAG TPA: DNA polymerase IV [Microbacteriaceae bacterium]|nr:DNA polymerase IV [Microbacteriaceae bacterium]
MSKQDGSNRHVSDASVDDSATPIMHVDLDAFFASVEILKDPSLRGKPVIVGGRGPRAVVSAASYEARKFGVNSAMPMALALQKCPNAIVRPVDGAAYAEYSRRVMAIFSDVTPLVQQLSVDEAFLDVSGARKLLGRPFDIGRALRERVRAETGLSCSVGIAASKFVAKVASGRAKPDGLLVVPAADTLDFLRPLPITALWGVGGVTAEKLYRLGLRTIADIADTPDDALQRAVGPALASRLHALSRGIDPRAVSTERIEKSIGHESTFRHDVTSVAELERILLSQSEDVARRLRRAGVRARTIAIKVRHSDFRTLTRSRTLAEPTDVAKRIHEEAVAALRSLDLEGQPIRLVGVRGENLTAGDAELALWNPDDEWRELERVSDVVTERFGKSALSPASLLGSRRRQGAGYDSRTGRGLESFDGEVDGRNEAGDGDTSGAPLR